MDRITGRLNENNLRIGVFVVFITGTVTAPSALSTDTPHHHQTNKLPFHPTPLLSSLDLSTQLQKKPKKDYSSILCGNNVQVV